MIQSYRNTALRLFFLLFAMLCFFVNILEAKRCCGGCRGGGARSSGISYTKNVHAIRQHRSPAKTKPEDWIFFVVFCIPVGIIFC